LDSYSPQDDDFAQRLYADLQAKNVRCWRFDENAKWGEPVWGEIDTAIRHYDKLVVICSKHSLQSQPVIREIERALQKEDREHRADGGYAWCRDAKQVGPLEQVAGFGASNVVPRSMTFANNMPTVPMVTNQQILLAVILLILAPLPQKREDSMDMRRQSARILIADDHPIFRTGLRTMLESQKDFRVVGEAADGAEAVKLALRLKPDILLLDLNMPKVSGLEALRQLAASSLTCRTILVATVIEKEETLVATELGARGVVLKDMSAKLLINCIRSVMANQFWIGQDSISGLVQAIRALEPRSKEADVIQRLGLTPRERQMVAGILSGLTNKDIAQEFSISIETVKRHLSSIFDKVGVSNRLELALFAIHHHLGPEELALRPTGSSVAA
jgi:DNA-binding NarL/FixJ family response regulator